MQNAGEYGRREGGYSGSQLKPSNTHTLTGRDVRASKVDTKYFSSLFLSAYRFWLFCFLRAYFLASCILHTHRLSFFLLPFFLVFSRARFCNLEVGCRGGRGAGGG